MTSVVQNLKSISSSVHLGSRVGAAFFTDNLRYSFNFDTCCNNGRSTLLRKLAKMQLNNNPAYFTRLRGDHRHLSPHRIDIKAAFQKIKSKIMLMQRTINEPRRAVSISHIFAWYVHPKIRSHSGVRIV